MPDSPSSSGDTRIRKDHLCGTEAKRDADSRGVNWDDPNTPAGNGPPMPRWPMATAAVVWLVWMIFLLVVLLTRSKAVSI